MRDGKELLCDQCGKPLRLLNGLEITGHLVNITADDPAMKKALKESFHPYPVKEYRSCMACMLKNFGFTVPAAESKTAELKETDGF